MEEGEVDAEGKGEVEKAAAEAEEAVVQVPLT